MRFLALLLILVVLGVHRISAQVEFKLLEFKISSALEDENKKDEPARFVVVPAQDSPYPFLADVAGKLEFLRYKSLKVSAFSEWHRNTLIAKEQHVQQLGFNVMATLWNERGDCRSCFAMDVDISGRYSHNLIAASGPPEIAIYNAYVTPYWLNSWKRTDFLRPTAINPAGTRPFAKVLQFSYVVFGGLEYIPYNEVPMSNLTARAEFYPLSATIRRVTKQYGNLIARVSYTYRDNLSGSSTDFDIGNLFTFGIRAQHKLNWNKNEATIAVGYDYSKGPDPLKGLSSQEYSVVTIKLKLLLRAARTFSQ